MANFSPLRAYSSKLTLVGRTIVSSELRNWLDELEMGVVHVSPPHTRHGRFGPFPLRTEKFGCLDYMR
jgi:hypothetical protein